MKKKLIPFNLLPASWGLAGESYKIAEANYYYEGEELDKILLDIKITDKLSYEYKKCLIDIDYKYGKITSLEKELYIRMLTPYNPEDLLEINFKYGVITEYEYDTKIAQLEKDDIKKQIAILDVEFKHQKISKLEHDKEVSTLEKKPWIDIIDHGFDPEKGINGVFFEFDWNELWIDYLRLNGYSGTSQEEIVEQWFNDVTRMVTDEERVINTENGVFYR